MGRKFFLVLVAVAATSLAGMRAQSPAPVVVQAQTATTTALKPVPAAAPDETEATITLLREMKAANEATLKKQQTALETLDELQKAAEQIKVFTKRS